MLRREDANLEEDVEVDYDEEADVETDNAEGSAEGPTRPGTTAPDVGRRSDADADMLNVSAVLSGANEGAA